MSLCLADMGRVMAILLSMASHQMLRCRNLLIHLLIRFLQIFDCHYSICLVRPHWIIFMQGLTLIPPGQLYLEGHLEEQLEQCFLKTTLIRYRFCFLFSARLDFHQYEVSNSGSSINDHQNSQPCKIYITLLTKVFYEPTDKMKPIY